MTRRNNNVSASELRLQWAKKKNSTRDNIANLPGAFWYNQLPKVFGLTVTIAGLLWIFIRVSCLIVIATSPFWIDYFFNNRTDWKNSLWMVIVLLCCLAGTWFYDTFVKVKTKIRTRDQHFMSAQNCLSVAYITLDQTIPDYDFNSSNLEKIQKFLESMLESIALAARAELGIFDRAYFHVSLLVFKDKNFEDMIIRARDKRTRKIDVEVNAQETMAFYVAKTGIPRVVHRYSSKSVPFEKKALVKQNTSMKVYF